MRYLPPPPKMEECSKEKIDESFSVNAFPITLQFFEIINRIQVEHFLPALLGFVYTPEIRNWGCYGIVQMWRFASRIPSSPDGTQLLAISNKGEV